MGRINLPQNSMENNPITVIMDMRENGSSIDRMLESYGAKVVVTNLEVADYILSDRVAVERKTAEDFLNSIKDGRLFAQAQELAINFESPLLIIEGKNLYSLGGLHPNSIRGAIASIATDYKIPMLSTTGPEETAAQMFWIAKREQVGEEKKISIRGKKKTKTMKEKQEFLLAGMPKVSRVMAQRLLRHFGSPINAFNAPENDLLEVKGVGKSMAKKIRLLLDTETGD